MFADTYSPTMFALFKVVCKPNPNVVSRREKSMRNNSHMS